MYGVDQYQRSGSRYLNLMSWCKVSCNRLLIRSRLQKFFRLPQIQVFRNWFKFRSRLMLLFADCLEQQHSPINMNIDEMGLPMGRADLGPLNFKPTAFGDAPENPKTKIHVLYQMPAQVGQPFLFRIDQDRSRHALESLGFLRRRDKGWVRSKVESQMGAVPAVVLIHEGAR